jgi:hypothetical protein
MEGFSEMAKRQDITAPREIRIGARLREELHREADDLINRYERAPEAVRAEIGLRLAAVRQLLGGAS